MLAQYAFRTMVEFKKTEIEQAYGLRMVVQSLDQQLNNPGQRSSRVFITLEPAAQLAADSKTAQTGFRGRPEEIFFSREMTEYRYFANPRQSGDLMGAAGRETLA